MANIVLAHGILGFGSIFPEQSISYFNGIKKLYESHGHEVLCPTVPALGTIAVRASKLEQQILNHQWSKKNDPISLLAHSMGGLDCRRVVAKSDSLKGRIKRLITIATPHYGSPVADALQSPPPRLPFSPLDWILRQFGEDAGALADLHTRDSLHDTDANSVDYLCIGCDNNPASKSILFNATATIGGFGEFSNDGVVSLSSASKSRNSSSLWATWHVDHGEAIGWPSCGTGAKFAEALIKPPKEHLERYLSLLPTLVSD